MSFEQLNNEVRSIMPICILHSMISVHCKQILSVTFFKSLFLNFYYSILDLQVCVTFRCTGMNQLHVCVCVCPFFSDKSCYIWQFSLYPKINSLKMLNLQNSYFLTCLIFMTKIFMIEILIKI